MIYARFSTRFQASIGDQVRACYEAAVARKIFVPVDHVCFDLAVRGSKAQRPGLGRAQALIEAGGVGVFLAFTTNRLHRKMHRCLRFVEEELVERGIRAIFPKSGVDTADTHRWKMLLNFHAMMDEFVVSMYADNVRAAHEGLMERGLVFGTLPFGYTGDPIPGQFTRRKRPRCRLDRRPPDRPGRRADLPLVRRRGRHDRRDRPSAQRRSRRSRRPRGRMTGAWTRTVVRALLGNARYRGAWQYGATQTVWQSKKDYARQVRRDEPLRSEQLEGLRIVPDDSGSAPSSDATRGRAAPGGSPPTATATPARGCSTACSAAPPTTGRCTSAAPTATDVLQGLQGTARDEAAPLLATESGPGPAADVPGPRRARPGRQRSGGAGDRRLRRGGRTRGPARSGEARRPAPQGPAVRPADSSSCSTNAGETEEDRRESKDQLRRLRRDRAEAVAELAAREADRARPVVVPDEAEVRSQLDSLGEILGAAAVGSSSEEGDGAAREIIAMLTGGRIDLEQCGERKAQRGWLRGRFRVPLLPYLAARAGGGAIGEMAIGAERRGVEVVVDYREPSEPEALAERAKVLSDEGLLVKQIATRLGVSRNLSPRRWRTGTSRAGLTGPRRPLEALDLTPQAPRSPAVRAAGRQRETALRRGPAQRGDRRPPRMRSEHGHPIDRVLVLVTRPGRPRRPDPAQDARPQVFTALHPPRT